MESKKIIDGKMKKGNEKTTAGSMCNDRNCPFHGNLKTRGRIFKGEVIKKFHKRVVIESERTVYIRKYERYATFRTRIHARLPECMEEQINIGDYITIRECRPLSKLVHFVVLRKLRGEIQ